MNNNVNHFCKICGVGYYACNDCDKTQNWRAHACSVEHYQIYNILSFFNLGYASKEETMNGLKSLGVTVEVAKGFIDGVRENALRALEEPKVEVKTEAKAEPKAEVKTETAPVASEPAVQIARRKTVKEKDEE